MSNHNKSNNQSHRNERASIVERLRGAGLLPRVLQDLLRMQRSPRGGQTVKCLMSVNHKAGDRHPSMVVSKNLGGANCKACGFGGGIVDLARSLWNLPSSAAAAHELESRYLGGTALPSVGATAPPPDDGPRTYPIPEGYWEDVQVRWDSDEGRSIAQLIGVPHDAVDAACGGLDPGGDGRPPSLVLESWGPDPQRRVRGRKFRYAPGQLRTRSDGKEVKSDTWGTGADERTAGLMNLRRLTPKRTTPMEVWLVAGEKDLLNAQARIDADDRGIVVLSPSNGEDQNLVEFGQTLVGCDVALLWDTDDRGRQFAPKRCAELVGHVRSIRNVVLPFSHSDRTKFASTRPDAGEPKDVTDWFALGHSIEELRAAVDATPPFTVADAEDVDPVEEANWLSESWLTVGAWGERMGGAWLTSPPPHRKYLLTIQENGCAAGVLPRGKVGMLVSGGGKGKTWFLALLAVSVATGVPLFERYDVSERGAVLLALAEEDAPEVRRRLYQIARLLHLSPPLIRMIEENVVVLPLCGHEVALQESESKLGRSSPTDQELAETPFAKAIRRRLRRAGREWRLIVFDPLSRFAGLNCEIDNAAGTRFVQILEKFTKVPGEPVVLFSHHANKQSRNGTTNETAARGSSALTDAVRWQANLDSITDPDDSLLSIQDYVAWRIVKSNYGRIVGPSLLYRDAKFDGALRLATKDETEQLNNLLAKSTDSNESVADKPKTKKSKSPGSFE